MACPRRFSIASAYFSAVLPTPTSSRGHLDQFWRESPNAFLRITSQITTLRYLMAVFSYSAFLSEAVLKNPQWLEQLGRGGDMHRVLMAEEYETRLRQLIGWESDQTPSAVELARFRREQVLRIVIRDVLNLGTLSDVTEELSNLADAILDLSYRRIRASLAAIHGEPVFNGEPAQFSVIALGKLGGRELNYSSDIDLMFIYEGGGETDGPHRISNKEFFKKIANSYTELLSTYTGGGMCYRVDLRLRPDGRYGEVCHSLEGAQNYYQTRGRDWELQMLIKGRVAAGEPGPGHRLLEFVEPLIYSTTLDFKAVESVSEARERINEKLKRSAHARRRRETGARRHSRYRVPGPVSAAPARRPGALGTPRRNAVCAVPPARQGPVVRFGIFAPRRGISVLAQPGAPPAIRRGPADPHASAESRCARTSRPQDARVADRDRFRPRELCSANCMATSKPCASFMIG